MFVFGLIVGLVIGGIIAILVYHNNQKKFNQYIDEAETELDEIQEDLLKKIDDLEKRIEDLLAPQSTPVKDSN